MVVTTVLKKTRVNCSAPHVFGRVSFVLLVFWIVVHVWSFKPDPISANCRQSLFDWAHASTMGVQRSAMQTLAVQLSSESYV